LQDYAKPNSPVAKETDLEVLCKEIIKKSGVPDKIRATCNVDENVKKIITDPELLRRIFSNLVSNAVQAMPKGGELEFHAYKEESNTVIEIKDTGVGIPDEIRSKLFTPLFTTKSKGQGFGLAVVKRLTEAMGGTVSFESENGKGTKFIVRLPLQAKW